MSNGVIVPKRIYREILDLLKWFRIYGGALTPQRRRRQILSYGGDSGAVQLEIVEVVRDLDYDDPDRSYPAGCAWDGCTAGGDWPLEDQGAYIVRLKDDGATVYDPAATYNQGDYCLYTVLATTSCTQTFGEYGYGYSLKYKCTNPAGTTGTFDGDDWELVDDSSAGQWKIDRPYDYDAQHGRITGEVTDMRNYGPWFSIGAEVPVVEIDFGAETYKLFHACLNYLGEEGNRSVAWNKDENRLMAVYR